MSADSKASALENELTKMQSFLHTNSFLCKLLRIEDRSEGEVKLELLDSLNRINQDKTGGLTMSFIIHVDKEIVAKVHGIDLSHDYYSLEKEAFHFAMTPHMAPHGGHTYRVLDYYKDTEMNRERARQMINKNTFELRKESHDSSIGSVHNLIRPTKNTSTIVELKRGCICVLVECLVYRWRMWKNIRLMGANRKKGIGI